MVYVAIYRNKIGHEGGQKEARIPNPFRLQIAMPKPCKFFVRVDMYKDDHVHKIKDEASAQCNKFGLDVSSECFEVLETGAEEKEEEKEEEEGRKDTQEHHIDGLGERVVKETATVEEIGLFHKSLRLKIKDGPCFDTLPNIYM